jgi:hypothetical protein
VALSDDDLVDLIVESLAHKRPPADWRSAGRQTAAERSAGKWGFHVRNPVNPSWTSLPMRRPFVSEHMARQLAEKEKAQKRIRVPKAAILSPLAEDWLQSRGIAVVRE